MSGLFIAWAALALFGLPASSAGGWALIYHFEVGVYHQRIALGRLVACLAPLLWAALMFAVMPSVGVQGHD